MAGQLGTNQIDFETMGVPGCWKGPEVLKRRSELAASGKIPDGIESKGGQAWLACGVGLRDRITQTVNSTPHPRINHEESPDPDAFA
ncbi:hypothetical protein E2562_008343 [Oryza meyeriana var. granulata]|uniref:Uncharacterized protein n=1 Tax=Oryza meyeriana var. granulata TaxID=110450 RepID=A0A6G1EJ61_9ORYZ|nr:hypothetical protein E2562_008343 [Oryza meyeriana var. granulata]